MRRQSSFAFANSLKTSSDPDRITATTSFWPSVDADLEIPKGGSRKNGGSQDHAAIEFRHV